MKEYDVFQKHKMSTLVYFSLKDELPCLMAGLWKVKQLMIASGQYMKLKVTFSGPILLHASVAGAEMSFLFQYFTSYRVNTSWTNTGKPMLIYNVLN